MNAKLSAVTVLLAFVAFTVGPTARTAEDDAARAVAALKSVGGKVQGDAKSVSRVDLSGSKATDADLVHLKSLPGVHTLNLSGCKITDGGLENLKGLTGLGTLDLLNCPITDAGLEHLKGLTSISSLNLRGTRITGAGLQYLKGMIRMQSLRLNLAKVGGGLVHLKGLTNLGLLNLGGTEVGDADMEQIKGLTKLQQLILYQYKGGLTDAGLAHIKGLTDLRMLNLRVNPVTDKGLEYLADMKKLSYLDLVGTRVTDAGLKHLQALSGLQSLRLRGPGFTDAGLEDLRKLTSLRTLELNATKITDAGMKQLQAALPNTKISTTKEQFLADQPTARPPKRVLLVTHAGGFMHDSLLTAEQILKDIGPKNGVEITCYRFTADPDAKIKIRQKEQGKEIERQTTALEDYDERFRRINGAPVAKEHCGRVNATALKKFDAVMFFTTSTWSRDRGSHPLTPEELKELTAWVKGGGAFIGVHCATDTLHGSPYGELVGATFGGHPWVQKVRLRAEDPKHPAAKGLTDGAEIHDEIYQFGPKSSDPRVPLKEQPYSRARLHIILSVDNKSIDVTKGSRADGDYPVAWCQQYGKGRSFYTSLGHHKEVWKDARFQEHILGGMRWAAGLLDGDATPSGQRK